jgi:hypothetical protein
MRPLLLARARRVRRRPRAFTWRRSSTPDRQRPDGGIAAVVEGVQVSGRADLAVGLTVAPIVGVQDDPRRELHD